MSALINILLENSATAIRQEKINENKKYAVLKRKTIPYFR
jgi:hypothetical protein